MENTQTLFEIYFYFLYPSQVSLTKFLIGSIYSNEKHKKSCFL
jgi:hypothetical protein